jgi:hypothetical protein
MSISISLYINTLSVFPVTLCVPVPCACAAALVYPCHHHHHPRSQHGSDQHLCSKMAPKIHFAFTKNTSGAPPELSYLGPDATKYLTIVVVKNLPLFFVGRRNLW